MRRARDVSTNDERSAVDGKRCRRRDRVSRRQEEEFFLFYYNGDLKRHNNDNIMYFRKQCARVPTAIGFTARRPRCRHGRWEGEGSVRV